MLSRKRESLAGEARVTEPRLIGAALTRQMTDLYLGISRSDGSFWRYDSRHKGRGIEPARRDEREELDFIVKLDKGER